MLPTGPACKGGPARPVVGRARRESDQEGAPAARRRGQCQDPKVHEAHCSARRWPPPPRPRLRAARCQRRCHGRRLFAGARGRAAATDGAGGCWGVAAASGETAQRCAVSSAARAPRASLAAKFGSTLRRALTPSPFHLPLQVLGGRGEPGGGPSAAPGPPARRRRRRAATATAARGRSAPAWGRRPAPASGRRRGPRGRPAPGARPPGSPGGPPDLGRLNRNCSPIDSTGPGRAAGCVCPSACGRQKGRKSVSGSRGGGTAQGTQPSLFMCLPAFAFFARRLQGASRSCVPRV